MQKIKEKEIAEILRSEIEKIKKEEHTEQYSAFGIIAEDDIGYAVPITNIIEIVLVPTEDVGNFITIDGEKIPCVVIREKTEVYPIMWYQTFCMLCKKNNEEKIAIIIGDIWDSFRFLVKSLPDWQKESLNHELKEKLNEGVYLYHGVACNGYQFNFIAFDD